MIASTIKYNFSLLIISGILSHFELLVKIRYFTSKIRFFNAFYLIERNALRIEMTTKTDADRPIAPSGIYRLS